MKKLASILLCLMLAFCVFAACSDEEAKETEEPYEVDATDAYDDAEAMVKTHKEMNGEQTEPKPEPQPEPEPEPVEVAKPVDPEVVKMEEALYTVPEDKKARDLPPFMKKLFKK